MMMMIVNGLRDGDRSSFSQKTLVGFLQHTCSKDCKIFTIDLRVEGLGIKMK